MNGEDEEKDPKKVTGEELVSVVSHIPWRDDYAFPPDDRLNAVYDEAMSRLSKTRPEDSGEYILAKQAQQTSLEMVVHRPQVVKNLEEILATPATDEEVSQVIGMDLAAPEGDTPGLAGPYVQVRADVIGPLLVYLTKFFDRVTSFGAPPSRFIEADDYNMAVSLRGFTPEDWNTLKSLVNSVLDPAMKKVLMEMASDTPQMSKPELHGLQPGRLEELKGYK